jgi:hypothetical protein
MRNSFTLLHIFAINAAKERTQLAAHVQTLTTYLRHVHPSEVTNLRADDGRRFAMPGNSINEQRAVRPVNFRYFAIYEYNASTLRRIEMHSCVLFMDERSAFRYFLRTGGEAGFVNINGA